MSTHEHNITGGWLRATRHTLGLSTDKLAALIDINTTTIRKRWEFGTEVLPDEVQAKIVDIVDFTDATVEHLRRKAEAITDPAIIVYTGRDDLPEGHIAHVYGRDWWDRVAYSVQRAVPEVMIGFPWEIAAAYEHSVAEVHQHPCVIGLYGARQPADAHAS